MNATSHPFMPFSHPWAQAIAQKNGQVVKGGLIFEPGVGDDVVGDFLGRLNNGEITAGKQLNNGQYVFTGGDTGSADWSQYSPGDGYERILALRGVSGSTTGRNDGSINHAFDRDPVQVWRRTDEPAAPDPPSETPTPETPVTPQPYDPAASTFNPLDYGTSEGFWSLADALGAPVKRYQAGDLTSWTGSGSRPSPSGEDAEDGGRFAGSEKFRRQLTGARAAIAAIPGQFRGAS